jgi:hypothetical protein
MKMYLITTALMAGAHLQECVVQSGTNMHTLDITIIMRHTISK